MSHLRRSPAALLLAAAVLCLAARPERCAADKSDPQKADAGPLDFVPADAVAVFSVRVADLWNYPPVKAALQKGAKGLQPLQQFREHFGLGLDEVERITLILEGELWEEEWSSVTALTTVKPYDKKTILGAVAPDASETTVGGRSFYATPRGPCVLFLDDHTFLIAREEKMEDYLKHSPPAKEGPLAPVIRMGSEKHILIAGMDMTALAATITKGPPVPASAKPFVKAQLATLTVDLDGQVKADARLTYAKEADAKDGAAGLNDDLDLARGGFAEMLKQLDKDGDAPKLTAFLKNAQAVVHDVKAEQKGATVEIEAAMKLDPDATTAALTEAVEKMRKASKRMEMNNDLRQLALGAINYAASHNDKMFPAAVTDKSGKPLLSWRVMVLPYIEQNELYKQFHLDEPWDSDNNKKLLEKMPTAFAPPDSEAFKKHETFYQALVGPGSVFDGTEVHYPASIPDGTSQTILFAEAAKSVPWTKPDDIPFDNGKLAPKLGGLTKDGFLVAFCDGSVRLLSRAVSEETLRAIVTRAAGDVPGADLDK